VLLDLFEPLEQVGELAWCELRIGHRELREYCRK